MNTRDWSRLVNLAEAETKNTLQSLPADLRERAEVLPLVFEPWLDDELVSEGLDPDLLGLFVGDPHHVQDSPDPMPPQIFLFLESIWEYAGHERAAFCEEVRVTYLHELGHYLGLDEDDLEDRGLE